MIQRIEPSVAQKIKSSQITSHLYIILKELIENALDAGALQVQIMIRGGGLESIQVTDDGPGIHPLDMGLLIAPNATSKIKSMNDLNQLQTFGFRGQALHGIASHAHLDIQTKQNDEDIGRCYNTRDMVIHPYSIVT